MIADIVLQLLSYVAQSERENINLRQAEGISAAKERGVKFGREALKRPEQFGSLRESWTAGKISAREAARLLDVSHTTFLKWSKQEPNSGN